MVSLSPNSLGLRLNTALGAQNRHASVQHSQGRSTSAEKST